VAVSYAWPVPEQPDIALVSLGTTMGWRRGDEAFAEMVRAAGATCEIVPVRIGAAGKLRRSMLLTDAVEAIAARRSAAGLQARAVVYSSITAALLQRPPAPYAVRFDTLAAVNRPGAGGVLQRAREPRVLERARLLLPWSQAGLDALPERVRRNPPEAVVLAPPLERVAHRAEPAVDAVAYAANPEKRGLELLCLAWSSGAPAGARLVVGGIDRERALRHLGRHGVTEPPGIEWAGAVPRERWLATVAGARAFVNASRYEDWGMAQMEALACGVPLVTSPTPGPNEALSLARRIAPDLVASEPGPDALARALRAGLSLDAAARDRYAAEAERLLEPYRAEAVQRVVAERVLPALGVR
jgi:glycosyltransferase involved in cell wall biosynthesis